MFKKNYYRLKNYFATDQGKQVVKRINSLIWRLGWMIAAAIVSWLLLMITEWKIPADIQVLLGLILGEISKFIRDNQNTPSLVTPQ